MAEFLGRVVVSDPAAPRGPDAIHRVRVPKDWLEQGAQIELELPRNLTCAACEGGGCDVCERSGAVTVRGRGEPSDLVEISLPSGTRDDAFVIRVPGRGGLPPLESSLPRGHLLVRIEPTAAPDASSSVAIRGRAIALAREAVNSMKPASGRKAAPRALLLGVPLLLAILLVIWLLFGR